MCYNFKPRELPHASLKIFSQSRSVWLSMTQYVTWVLYSTTFKHSSRGTRHLHQKLALSFSPPRRLQSYDRQRLLFTIGCLADDASWAIQSRLGHNLTAVFESRCPNCFFKAADGLSIGVPYQPFVWSVRDLLVRSDSCRTALALEGWADAFVILLYPWTTYTTTLKNSIIVRTRRASVAPCLAERWVLLSLMPRRPDPLALVCIFRVLPLGIAPFHDPNAVSRRFAAASAFKDSIPPRGCPVFFISAPIFTARLMLALPQKLSLTSDLLACRLLFPHTVLRRSFVASTDSSGGKA